MIEVLDVHGMPLEDVRRLYVYLPDCLERCPVTYVLDGQDLFYDEDARHGRSWRLARFLERWGKPMIVVGIGASLDEDRRRCELAPWERMSAGRVVDPRGEQLLRWVERDLKPSIDETYPTWSHREATGIVGAGTCGLLSLYALIAHNATFGKAASLSAGVRFAIRELDCLLAGSPISADTRACLSFGETEAGRLYESGAGPVDPCWDSAEGHASHAVADELARQGAAVMVSCAKQGRARVSDWERQLPRCMDFLWLDRRQGVWG